jgi:NADPH:quinone reductase-like Zn-dependent oxidoreductase
VRAIQVSEFGGPEILVGARVPEPVPGPGQVVVEVAVAPTDFVQTQLRSGVTPGPPLPEPPYVPGATVSGEVVAAGDGVDPRWLGRRIVTHTVTGYGGYTELSVSTVDSPITVPDEVGLLEAPASHDDGSTAIGLMEGAAVQPGEWVLVEAEGGGVGSLLVQLAVAVGTQVVGAARRPAKLDLACELGAKAVVDYPPSPLPRACARWRATSGGWWRCGCCRAPRPGCRPAQDLEVQREPQHDTEQRGRAVAVLARGRHGGHPVPGGPADRPLRRRGSWRCGGIC